MQRATILSLKARSWSCLFFLLLLIRSPCDGTQLDQTPTLDGRPPQSQAVVDDGSGALSPDDALFAHLRCLEQFASKQSSERALDVASWLGADGAGYLNRTDRTPHFLKCVLTKLGLYDEQAKVYNANVLKKQFQAYHKWMTVGADEVHQFSEEANGMILAGNSSGAVYETFERLLANFSSAYFELFLRDPVVLQKLYHQQEFPVRKPNETVIEFCEHQMSEELWNDICQIRAYEISNRTDAMEAHITCIFRGFHYLTEQGLINEIEIVQDFTKASVLTDESEANIKDCATEALRENLSSKRSLRMYSCLLDGATREQFKEAFDFREIRSGNLSYLLQNLPYERDQVKRQILQLDRERCNDQQEPTHQFVRL